LVQWDVSTHTVPEQGAFELRAFVKVNECLNDFLSLSSETKDINIILKKQKEVHAPALARPLKKTIFTSMFKEP
jgi:hypothetical protein